MCFKKEIKKKKKLLSQSAFEKDLSAKLGTLSANWNSSPLHKQCPATFVFYFYFICCKSNFFFFFFRMMHGDMINFREDKNILFYFIKICVFIIQNYFFFFFNSCRLLKIINFFSFMCYLITWIVESPCECLVESVNYSPLGLKRLI